MSNGMGFRIRLVFLVLTVLVLLSSCVSAMSLTSTPTADWRTSPTYVYYVPPSDASEYSRYTPSESSKIQLEFEYPSYWLRHEYIDEVGIPRIFLGDPRFLTLPTPSPPSFHPTPNDFGNISIWIIPGKSGQTPETELESHIQNYSNNHRYTVLSDYKITIDGQSASVLEYQVKERMEGSPSVMFDRRIYFMVEGQVYEIIFTIAVKDRDGEFEKGYEYFFNSLNILP